MRAFAMRMTSLSVMAVLFSGCAFMRAVTFRSDPNSFVREGTKTQLTLYSPQPQKKCEDGPPREELAPAAAVIALLPLAMSIAESEIQGYLDKKKKEFTASYNASRNAALYYRRVGEREYSRVSFTCLWLQRAVKEGDAYTAAFEWFATLVPNDSGTALMIRTDTIKLIRAAARTDKEKGKVDVTVDVKIDATTLSEKGDVLVTTVASKTLAFPGLKIGGEDPKDPPRFPMESSWFSAIPLSPKEADRCEALQRREPKCGGVSAVNAAVSVTEVGSGGEAFGELGKLLGDNKKALEDVINKAVTDALTPKSPAGTSKPGK